MHQAVATRQVGSTEWQEYRLKSGELTYYHLGRGLERSKPVDVSFASSGAAAASAPCPDDEDDDDDDDCDGDNDNDDDDDDDGVIVMMVMVTMMRMRMIACPSSRAPMRVASLLHYLLLLHQPDLSSIGIPRLQGQTQPRPSWTLRPTASGGPRQVRA